MERCAGRGGKQVLWPKELISCLVELKAIRALNTRLWQAGAQSEEAHGVSYSLGISPVCTWHASV